MVNKNFEIGDLVELDSSHYPWWSNKYQTDKAVVIDSNEWNTKIFWQSNSKYEDVPTIHLRNVIYDPDSY